MHFQALIITSIFLSAVFAQVWAIYSLSLSLIFKESIMESVERDIQ
jgi:F0F1-type ATP synthase membrane subunit c/vacuolar-type H+-ATPase subunit K